jgi:hypothetical protein
MSEGSKSIDHKTSRSICEAVGERLRQNLKPDPMAPSSHLRHLMDELRKQDREIAQRRSN